MLSLFDLSVKKWKAFVKSDNCYFTSMWTLSWYDFPFQTCTTLNCRPKYNDCCASQSFRIWQGENLVYACHSNPQSTPLYVQMPSIHRQLEWSLAYSLHLYNAWCVLSFLLLLSLELSLWLVFKSSIRSTWSGACESLWSSSRFAIQRGYLQ